MAMPQAGPGEAELADLEQVWAGLDVPGHRVELLDGCIVVSPSASRSHSRAVQWLIQSVIDRVRDAGWEFHTNLTLHVAATRERLIPDLMISPRDAPQFDENELYGHGTLLVAEVTSPSSQGRDRIAKVRAYAQAQVPLYLIIDLLAEPIALTLFSGPDRDGYRRCDRAAAGQPLVLPEPFGISLDTGTLPR